MFHLCLAAILYCGFSFINIIYKHLTCTCMSPVDTCVCRLRGDPIVETYDGQWMALLGTKKYTFTKHMVENDRCSFNVEVKTGEVSATARGQTYPRYLDVMIHNLIVRMAADGRVFVSITRYSLFVTRYSYAF